MASIADIRAQYPQYKDIPDNELADAFHQKFYSDIPKADFYKQIGMGQTGEEVAQQINPPGQKPDQSYSSPIFPVSIDKRGNLGFDMNAGIPGYLIRAITAPRDAYQGKFDAMSDEGIKRAGETAALISPISTASRAGEQVVPGVLTTHQKAVPKPPTAEALKAASDAGYKKAGEMGVDYASAAVKGFADDAARYLDEEGFIAELSPKTAAILRKLQEPPPDSVASLKSLDAFRKQLGRIGGSPDATEAAAANIVLRRLDEFLQTGNPSNVVVGTSTAVAPGAANLPRITGPAGPSVEEIAQQAAQTLAEARGNAAAGFRSGRLTGLEESAANRAAASNSGQNIGNTIRGRLASLLDSDKASRGFSKEELAAIEQVIQGTTASNATRRVGNMLGGGGGIAQTALATTGATIGGTLGGVPGAVVGAGLPTAVGTGARAVSNGLTRAQLEAVDAMVRSRSPLYAQMLRDAPMVVPNRDPYARLTRALLSSYLSEMDGQPAQ